MEQADPGPESNGQPIGASKESSGRSGQLRVVVGEDNFLAREALLRVFERAPGFDVVAACGDLAELRTAIDEKEPDVVVTDIRMPPTNYDEGIQLASELRSTHPDIGVVVLSQHDDPSYAMLLFEEGSGGRAYLLKETLKSPAALTDALQTVAEGGSIVDPLVVEKLLAARQRSEDSRLDSLTPRELEVLGLVAEGKSNGAIADELFVTKRAIERHTNGIFGKLGLQDGNGTSRRVKAALLHLSGRRIESDA